MPAHTPEDVHRLFTERFVAGDVDGLLELYESDAALVPQPGQVVSGAAAIREAMGGFLALGGQFEMTPTVVAQTGDVALLCSPWRLTATGPDGSPLNLAATTTDVVRRQPDGSWRIAIDNPWGAG